MSDRIHFQCPSCHKSLWAATTQAGRRVQCACGTALVVPEPVEPPPVTMTSAWEPVAPPAEPFLSEAAVWRLLAAGAAVVLVAAVGVAALALRSGGAAQPIAASAMVGDSSSAGEAVGGLPLETPVAPGTRVAITTVPSGAAVRANGRFLGTSPLEANLEGHAVLVATLAGHEDAMREIDPASANQAVELTLNPKPAVYHVEPQPADAELKQVMGAVTLDRQGSQWTFTIAQPTAGKEVHVVFSRPGYADFEQTLAPTPGVEQTLAVVLQPSPAEITVAVDPPDAVVTVTGEGAVLTGEGSSRRVSVSWTDPQTITILATRDGYESLEMPVAVAPGDSQQFTLQLAPRSAWQVVEDHASYVIIVIDEEGRISTQHPGKLQFTMTEGGDTTFEFDIPGSLWYISKVLTADADYQGVQLQAGNIYRFDENRLPVLTEPEQYSLWITYDRDVDVLDARQADGAVLATVPAATEMQLLIPDDEVEGWHLVRTVEGFEGWIGDEGWQETIFKQRVE